MLTTRRQFLVNGLQVSAAIPVLGWLGLGERRTASETRARAQSERVLVVLQLTGGNDGLNMVVPHRQDAYFRSRPTIGLGRATLHALDDDHGLHPEMGALVPLHADGKLACVHGVGYPGADRSHFRSMEIWHSADPDHPLGDTGWLGRLADQLAERDPTAMPALHVGEGDLPLALRSRRFFVPSVEDPRGFQLADRPGALKTGREELLGVRDAREPADLAFLRDAARTTYRAAERMAELAARPAAVDYPDHDLARRLELVSRLVTGGFGTRIFHVALEGFDTHARQAPVQAALLQQLASGLAAFQRDLDRQEADTRVATLVFSEFGRRVEENGSKGTDHGAAAPVLIVGGSVRGGMHGTPPDLARLVEGDVGFTTDFRSIYRALASDWLGLESELAQPPLALFRA